MKKFFSLVLALVMALSLTTVAFGATTVTDLAGLDAALTAGETDIVVEGVVFDSNPFNGKYYVDRNIDFVGCTFTADMNWMYINNATFTNCTFNSTGAAVHYDEIKGSVVFNNCTFTAGKVQLGAGGAVTFNNCEFADTASTNIWSDNGIRVYSPAEFNDCEFNNRVVLAGANDLPTTFNACTMNDGTPVYYTDNADGIIRGGNVPFVGTDVTKDANGKYTGGTFSATPAADAIAPGYVFANGSVVNNAGNFVGSSSALTSSTATYGATLADALANKTHTVEVKAALEASASLKSFQTYQVFVTKLADKTVSVLPNQYIVVPTDVNADVVVVDGSKIIFLAQVAGVTKYDDNAEAVKVAYNAKPACDDVYVASAADAGVYYLYKNAYYVECDAVSADKVFNVDGVAVAAKATNLVKTLAHTYAFDTKTVGTKTEVTKVYCTVCKDSFSFVVGDLADAVKTFGAGNYADTGLNDANGDDIFVRTASGLVYVPVTPGTSTDKVESAATFDAGIAMYVGMSVMAAAGSAVVIGKKKD